MISFKDYLAERAVTKWSEKAVDVKKAVDLLNKHCKKGLDAIANGGLLFRGFRHTSAASVIDASTGERTSRDTNNLYQLMMDNSSSLKKYPKRSKSLICSTVLSEAARYGTPTVVIPFDGTKLVCSDEDDFFMTAVSGDLVDHQQIDDVTETIEDVLAAAGMKTRSQYVSIEELDDFVKANKEKFAEEWQEMFGTGILPLLKGAKPFTSLSSILMTPENLSLYVETFGEPIHGDRECWFSGPAVVIDARLFAGILHAMRESGMRINKNVTRQFTDDRFFDQDEQLDDEVVNYIKNNL